MIEIQNLTKQFPSKEGPITVLDSVSLTIEDGDIYGIIGLSGAGKSTLIRCINMLERPTHGSVIVDGKDLTQISMKEVRAMRSRIGMIFQHFNLLEQRTALGNVCFPLELAKVGKKERVERARALLKTVGLADKENAYPSELSGGQQQRVAIARALATNPSYLLCDEATSALDPSTTVSILELLKEINQTMGVTVVIITHEMKVVESICNKVAVLDHARIAEAGEMAEIFCNPTSGIAKSLILPEKARENPVEGRVRLRLLFNGEKTFMPIVSQLILKIKTPVSIVFADMKDIDGKMYGHMVIEVEDNEDAIREVCAHLDEEHVAYVRKGA